MSSEKSSWPGVSRRLKTQSPYSNVITEVTTEMPRSFSMPIQSERVETRLRLAFTSPASWIAPPNSSSFSVSVVLPASGWEMMAKVRRRATGSAGGASVRVCINMGRSSSRGCGLRRVYPERRNRPRAPVAAATQRKLRDTSRTFSGATVTVPGTDGRGKDPDR